MSINGTKQRIKNIRCILKGELFKILKILKKKRKKEKVEKGTKDKFV